jgi:hypothetical protein
VTLTVQGAHPPDSKLAREITELVRYTESPLLFHHSSRVDDANAACEFLRSHDVTRSAIDTVWTAIALHTTPGIPRRMHPVVALVEAYPRGNHFKEDIIQAFYDGTNLKPDPTFGNVKFDVPADKDSTVKRGNFCGVIRGRRGRRDETPKSYIS